MNPELTFDTPLSPYKFGKKVGKRPQMVYNYITNGLIKVRVTETGKMVVDPDEQQKWYQKWNEKKEDVVVMTEADLLGIAE